MGKTTTEFSWSWTTLRVEVRDEPVEGFVMGLGDVLHYDGDIVGAVTNVMNIEERWPIALVPGQGAFCVCDRCVGEYSGRDANSYGRYGYGGCLSVLDDPCGDMERSDKLLEAAYHAWSDANPELTAPAELEQLRHLVSGFLHRDVGFAALRREAAKWGAV